MSSTFNKKLFIYYREVLITVGTENLLPPFQRLLLTASTELAYLHTSATP